MLSDQIKVVREMGFKQHLQDEEGKRVTPDGEEQTAEIIGWVYPILGRKL